MSLLDDQFLTLHYLAAYENLSYAREWSTQTRIT
jgi:hypothetical protein